VIVDPRCRDVGMSQPVLYFGNVGLMIKGVRCCRRAQGVGADLEAQQRRILPHQFVNPVRGDRFLSAGAAAIA
jgi:hypothetical protein